MDALTEPVLPVPKLHVLVTREMFIEFFTLTLDNGYTEEMEPDAVRTWFKERGANMDVVEKCLDHAWNFMRAEINISNPKEPSVPVIAHAPKL
jgi:hypothetical protein